MARAVVGIAPGCGDALGSFRAPDHAAPAEKAAPSGLKVLRISETHTEIWFRKERNEIRYGDEDVDALMDLNGLTRSDATRADRG